MTVEPAIETESEADRILAYLIAERTDARTPKLSVSATALLRKAAHILASDDASDARDLTELLRLAPAVCRPGAVPPPTLAQVCAPDRAWDLEALSNGMLQSLEHISAVAQGRGCAVESPRLEACLSLASYLDHATPEPGYVLSLLVDVLRPLTLDALHPSHARELNEARSQLALAEQEVERLKAMLEGLVSGKVSPLDAARQARAVAEAQAPIVSRSSVETLAEITGAAGRYLGDMPSSY